MNPNNANTSTSAIKYLVALGVFIFALGGWLWHGSIFSDPENTFWSMVESNLQTSSVGREVTQESSGAKLDQRSQLVLGAQNYARSISVINQLNESGQGSKVTTETVATPDAGFSRYTDIQVSAQDGKQQNFDGVLNVWSKESDEDVGQGQDLFTEMVYSVIPFARLNPAQQQELVDFARESGVYNVNFDSVKRETVGNQRAYRYTVQVSQAKYIELLQKLDKITGLNNLGDIDATQYEGIPPIEVQMVVGVDSRQLLATEFVNAGRQEKYMSYGAIADFELPTDAIPRAELEQKVQSIIYGQ